MWATIYSVIRLIELYIIAIMHARQQNRDYKFSVIGSRSTGVCLTFPVTDSMCLLAITMLTKFDAFKFIMIFMIHLIAIATVDPEKHGDLPDPELMAVAVAPRESKTWLTSRLEGNAAGMYVIRGWFVSSVEPFIKFWRSA